MGLVARIAITLIGVALSVPILLQVIWSLITSPTRFFARVSRKKPSLPEGFSERMLKLDTGVRLHAVESGPAAAKETILFLHGFPECSHSWRHQMTTLAERGYRCVAIDQRGYNTSDKPSGAAAYHIARLSADVAAVARALGCGRLHLCGHDWGGAVAWDTAMRYPELLKTLTILNSPHPIMYGKNAGLGQLRKSWYMAMFQVPFLPELVLSAFDYRGVVAGLKKDLVTRAHAPGPDDFDAFKFSVSRPGALTAMINWYRAMMLPGPREEGIPRRSRVIEVPTNILWGTADKYLEFGLNKGIEKLVPDVKVQSFNASHWLQQELPNEVSRAMEEFYKSVAARK